MENPSKITEVVLDGHSLTLESFVAVARFGARVSLSGEAREAMARSRALAEKIRQGEAGGLRHHHRLRRLRLRGRVGRTQQPAVHQPDPQPLHRHRRTYSQEQVRA